MAKQLHIHYWHYPHNIIEGRTDNEVVVVRYCGDCGVRQMTTAKRWANAKGDYARDEHYAQEAEQEARSV